MTMARIVKVFTNCDFNSIAKLTAMDAQSKVASYLKTRLAGGLSATSCNHYLTAVKNFLHWASRESRMAQSPILLLSKLTVLKTLQRRSLTDEEFDKLIEATDKGPVSHQLTGEQRVWLYQTAANTGFRASELYSLTAESFHLGEGYVYLEARFAKNRRETRQPISKAFAQAIGCWLSTQGSGKLWTRLACKRAGEMIGEDLVAAKIERTTTEGVVDFHALRVFYVTQLCRTIRNPKTIQTLARHSTMELTMKVYAKVNPSDAAIAIDEVQIGTKKLNQDETTSNNGKQKKSRKAK
jgi:integrase/recombinase XerD